MHLQDIHLHLIRVGLCVMFYYHILAFTGYWLWFVRWLIVLCVCINFYTVLPTHTWTRLEYLLDVSTPTTNTAFRDQPVCQAAFSPRQPARCLLAVPTIATSLRLTDPSPAQSIHPFYLIVLLVSPPPFPMPWYYM